MFALGLDHASANGQTGSYSGIQEAQAGHSQFDAYGQIKRHFRMVTSVWKHPKLWSI